MPSAMEPSGTSLTPTSVERHCSWRLTSPPRSSPTTVSIVTSSRVNLRRPRACAVASTTTTDRATTVWHSIALHTSVGLANRFGPEQSVSHLGISFDINGMEKNQLSHGFAARVHAAWPRHDLGYAIAELIAQGTRSNPMKAPPFSFPAHLHAVINGTSIAFLDLVKNSGWGDQP